MPIHLPTRKLNIFESLKRTLLYLCSFLCLAGCGPKNTDDEIPLVPVNFYVDLNVNTSLPLNNLGGYIYRTEGNKGIVIIHNYNDAFLAIERTCSYHPYDSCNLITMDNNGLELKCGKYNGNDFVPCCGSKFTMEGYVNKGPATRPLRSYSVTKNGSQLHVTN
jgi:hypothetical protein